MKKNGIKINIDLRIDKVVTCNVCGRIIAVKVEAVAWINEGGDEVRKEDERVFEMHERIELRRVRGIGVVDAAVVCKRCYGSLMDYVNQVLRDLGSFANSYGIASVDGIDKVIEFASVEEMKRFIEDQAVWVSEPKLGFVEARPSVEVYAIAVTAMLKTVKDAKPLVAELYVPIERLLSELSA